MIYDYIIVGGGTAGCVLANRLSASGDLLVLLIEAGRDIPPNLVPEDIADTYAGRAYVNRDYQWTDLKAFVRPVKDDGSPQPARRRYEQAKIMGGCSSINGQVALRGAAADYDAWASNGATGWTWEDVLPYFKRLERDLDFSGGDHNDSGPMPIRRVFPDQWDRLAQAVGEVLRQTGFDELDDLNSDYIEGFGSLPLSNAYGRRVSSASAYLGSAVRARKNLTIKANVQVLRVVIEKRCVTGVEVVEQENRATISGRNVVVCAGAILSPKLLLASGVGAANILSKAGIPIQADIKAVGQGLQDHAAVAISAYLPKDARFNEQIRRHSYINLRYSSHVEGCPPVDMVLNPVSRSAWHPLGLQLCTFQVFLAKPFSRGSVTLNDNDPAQSPEVRFNLLSDERDWRRLMKGLRMVQKLLSAEPLRSIALDPFPSSYSAAAQSIGRITLVNKLLTGIGKFVMDGPGPLRRKFISTTITGGKTLTDLVANDKSLESFVRDNVSFGWHGCSTCRMGRENDSEAVVDPRARVRGIQGLRVADASIMPEIPRANIAIPTIMLAEKISDHILQDRKKYVVAPSAAQRL